MIDLTPFAGEPIELSIAYASDWATQGLGVFLDDVTHAAARARRSRRTSAAGPSRAARGQRPECEHFDASRAQASRRARPSRRTTPCPGLGIEGITGEQARKDVVGRTMQYLLR